MYILQKEETITLFDNELLKERTFKIYLKKVAFLDLSWIKNLKYDAFESDTKQQCIQALDIILRHGPASRYVSVIFLSNSNFIYANI